MKSLTTLLLSMLLCSSIAFTQKPADREQPRIDRSGVHPALIVEGKPFLMLSAQVNNSSAWQDEIPAVWRIIDDLGVTTLEAPVYWETLEPTEGNFDFTQVDMLLREARTHNKHLVLLWFGTWKNGSPRLYSRVGEARSRSLSTLPNMRTARQFFSLSPFGRSSLAADVRAFTTLIAASAAI